MFTRLARLFCAARHSQPAWNARRSAWAQTYDKGLAGLLLQPVVVRPDNRSCHHLYVVRSPRRDALQAHLQTRGINTGIHYPIPLHLQQCYRRLNYAAGAFPNAEKACSEVLSLPMFPELEQAQVERVIEAVREFDEQQGLSSRAA